MIKKRIAIFAYNHPESTLPIAKYLATRGYSVDYYYVTFARQEGSSAISFGRKVWFPGLRWNNKKHMKTLYEYMNSDDVRIFLFVLPPFALRYFSWVSRFMFKTMGYVLRLLKYDFINIVGQNPPLIDLLSSLGSGGNIFVSLHEVTPHYGSQDVNFKLIDYLLKSRTNIIVHSSASFEKLAKYDASMADHIFTIPFGVFETYALFNEKDYDLNLPDDYILYFGTILPYKGLDVLYEAINLLGSRLGAKKVVVAGSGTDPIIRKMKNDNRYVVINRFLSNQEIVAINSSAYCIICPYKSASQSGIISTSFFFSLPIVASNVGGFREYISHGKNGLLVEADNPAALSEAIFKLISDESLHAELRKGAAQFSTSARYSWDAIADCYLTTFYRQNLPLS